MMENVPKWANYVAQDADGRWYAYKSEPTIIDIPDGWWAGTDSDQKSQFIKQDKPNPDYWRNTLIKVKRYEVKPMNKNLEVLKHTPNWANYIAQDADGEWNAFMGEPFIYGTMNSWMSADKKLIYKGEPNPDYWKETLRKVNKDSAMDKDTDLLQSIVDSMKAGEDPSSYKWYNKIGQNWLSCTNWDEVIEQWLFGKDIKQAEPEKTYMDQEGTIWAWQVPLQKAPKPGTTYFIPDIETGSYQVRKWKDSGKDRLNLNNGVAHKTAEGAVHQAHALQAFSRE